MAIAEQYLQQIIHGGASVQRVVLADKLHNGRSLLGSLHQIGHQTWHSFHGSADDTLWFYQTLLTLFTTLKPGWMTYAFSQVVQHLVIQILATPDGNRCDRWVAQPLLNPLMNGAIAPP